MPPSEQEERCADAICQHLRQTTGNDWRVESWLDDEYPSEPSPDVVLSDGTDDIAIEFKQLTDGTSFHTYDWAQRSLYERLAPDSTRVFTLLPPPSIRLPLDPGLVEQIRSRIAVAATDLQVGGSATVLIRRRATVRFLQQSHDGLVICLHARSDDVRAVSPQVSGLYLVEDDGPDHQFLSGERRLEFHRALSQACEESKHSEQAEVEWFEEWELRRDEDSVEGGGGVLVIAVVAEFLEAAAIESVKRELGRAKKKFEGRKWAGRSAVALHAGEQQHTLSPALFQATISGLEPADVQLLDSLFLVSRNRVGQFNFPR